MTGQPISWGEYRPDVAALNAAFTSSIANVLPRGDGYGPFKDLVGFTSALAAACRGYFCARKQDGTVSIFAGTSTKLYNLDNTTFAWTDVSKGASTYSALPSTAHWQFAQFNNFVIAVQANTVPQVFDLTSSSAFADLGGSPPQAAYIAVVNRFLVLSGLLSYPYRVQWSGLNATTTWTSGTNYSDYQDLPDGGPARQVVGGELGVILQDNAIRRMTFSPGSDIVFQIDRLASDTGLLCPYSVAVSSEKIFFLSSKGFMQTDSSGVLNPIGVERVDRTFLDSYNSAAPQLVIAAADPVSHAVVWSYQSIDGSASGLFDTLLTYNWALNKWTPVALSGEYISSLSRPGLTLEGLDTISASVDALTFSLDDVSTSALSRLSAVGSDHAMGFFTGENLEATLETTEITDHGFRTLINGFTPITDAGGGVGCAGGRDALNGTLAYGDESTLNEDGFCPLLEDMRHFRLKLRIPAGESWTYSSGVVTDTMRGSPL